MYHLTYNIVERLKVSSTEQYFDNRMYESYPQNDDFFALSFDGDQRLISWRRIYSVNDDIVFCLNNGSIVYMYTNIM